ncbi:hypothetical protein DVJ78_08180 [Humibacter sp. BT305]|nr:hypothetical protein DVJ78_08180 [Humibacter sp. BT305]
MAKHEQIAAMLRESIRQHAEDGVFLDIIGELAATSIEFSVAWAADSPLQQSGTCVFVHAQFGKFDLTYHQLDIEGGDGETLIIWSPTDDNAQTVLDALGAEEESEPG